VYHGTKEYVFTKKGTSEKKWGAGKKGRINSKRGNSTVTFKLGKGVSFLVGASLPLSQRWMEGNGDNKKSKT